MRIFSCPSCSPEAGWTSLKLQGTTVRRAWLADQVQQEILAVATHGKNLYCVRRHPHDFMASKSSNSGTCALCGLRAGKAKMVAHLDTCTTSSDSNGSPQLLIRLRVDDRYDPRYWIYVEVRADATLRHLDAFLRQLWLECCGHLSAFSVDRRELAMGGRAGVAFYSAGTKFHYEYDFASTTALTGLVLKSRSGSIGRAPVRLLARNDPLVLPCVRCASPATLVCPYCPEDGLFCTAHAEAHEHAAEEIYLPVVNSPRMGVCGYTG
jgi:hypothetical protein